MFYDKNRGTFGIFNYKETILEIKEDDDFKKYVVKACGQSFCDSFIFWGCVDLLKYVVNKL